MARPSRLPALKKSVGLSGKPVTFGAAQEHQLGGPDDLGAFVQVVVDLRVLAFTGGIAIATSILFTLLPLVTIDRGCLGLALQDASSHSTPGVRRHRLQAGLVVSTVMLACVLLVGAGLFIRSFSALMQTDPGFNPDRVLTASLTLPRAGYSTAPSVRNTRRTSSSSSG